MMQESNRLFEKENAPLGAKAWVVFTMSIPTICAQLASIALSYVDAAMVGRLGADESAAVGLVSTTTWLFWGMILAISVGIYVQVSHCIGAKAEAEARHIMKQGFVVALGFSVALLLLALVVSAYLPHWLGGDEGICAMASTYFAIYMSGAVIFQVNNLATGLLQSSGNMKVPGTLNMLVCVLNAIYNFLLIFPSNTYEIAGFSLYIPGAGMGIAGAALGSVLAEASITIPLLYFLLIKSPALHLRRGEGFSFKRKHLVKSGKLGLPVFVDQIFTCGAYIASTAIVAPLGTIALAAHSFAITAESFCYSPGYGIAQAATAITGQCYGAKKPRLMRDYAWLAVALAVAFMSITGAMMFFASDFMMSLLTPEEGIKALGAAVLRIEAFAEPLYASAIVAGGVLRGMGKTKTCAVVNFTSMWIVRIPASALLAMKYGLQGVWLAMCIELCVRGMIFLMMQWRALQAFGKGD